MFRTGYAPVLPEHQKRKSVVKAGLTPNRYRSMWSIHRADWTFWGALAVLACCIVLLEWVARVWLPGTSPIIGWQRVGLLP